MGKLIVLNGKLINVDYGEDDGIGIEELNQRKTFNGNIINVSSQTIPLAKYAENNLSGKKITIRYLIADKIINEPEQMLSKQIQSYMGVSRSEFTGVYSDLTGYLWTEEKFKVGGHDIISDLNNHMGEFIHMEIEIH